MFLTPGKSQMENTYRIKTITGFWSNHNTRIILFILLFIFMVYSVFIAVNLKPGLIPDEQAHFLFSKHYSSTWGIPPDVPETYGLGWYIQQNPFLYYWINGRIINIIDLFKPNISEWETLILLRLINVLYAVGTVIVCYLLSKELIKHRWWQLLPVFLLTNTLMFVFLAGGVNYDNLANLLSITAILFLVRVLIHRDFISNSLGWLISIFSGTLVKYPILPLALVLSIVWLVFIYKNKEQVFPLVFQLKRHLFSAFVLLALIVGNLVIYGYNLIVFQAITPQCGDILTKTECIISPYYQRYTETALERKLTISESIDSGYPDPATYIIDSWVPNMLYRIFGILGHLSYFPARTIIIVRLLFYWVILWTIRFWRKPSFVTSSMISIFSFYTLVLFIINYNSELVYGFRQIAVQGRYIFPVIGIAYVLFSIMIKNIPIRTIKYLTLIATLGIFIYSGPFKFILYYGTFFSGWFLR